MNRALWALAALGDLADRAAAGPAAAGRHAPAAARALQRDASHGDLAAGAAGAAAG